MFKSPTLALWLCPQMYQTLSKQSKICYIKDFDGTPCMALMAINVYIDTHNDYTELEASSLKIPDCGIAY